MTAVLENPAIRARVHAISVAEYHGMIATGLLPENVELIRGALVEKISQSPLHGSIVELLREWIAAAVPADHIVRQEKPLTLDDSEPEPDVAVVRGTRGEFLSIHPHTAELIVEVAVSSETVDRMKLHLYAEAGVRECWLVLAEERVIERHTEPQGDVYSRIERANYPVVIKSTVLPGLMLLQAGIFPE